MIRWLRKLLGFGDVYVVRDVFDEYGEPIIAIATSIQGAELIKANYVARHAESENPATGSRARAVELMADRVTITNFDVEDI